MIQKIKLLVIVLLLLTFNACNKDDDSSSKESVEFKDEGDYSRLDYGLNFGLGIDLDKFSVCAGYDLGLANTTRVSSGSDFKSNNSTLKFTLGYKL